MAWVVNTIAKLILNVLFEIFKLFSKNFIQLFGINIGAQFTGMNDKTSRSLVQVMDSYAKGNSVFDVLFPMETFKRLFVMLAVVIATFLLVLELVKALSSPMTRGRKQHPAASVAKYFVAIPCIFGSYRLLIAIEYVANELYISFANAAMNSIGVPAGQDLPDLMVESSNGQLAANGIGLAFESFTMMTGAGAITGFAATVINLIIIWLLFTNFLRLMIELLERYVVMGFLFYSAPLPFSALASEETRGIFSSWCKMLFSQMLLLITNGLFLSVFLSGLLRLSFTQGSVSGAFQTLFQTFGINSQITWMIYMMALIAWLLLAQRFDSYLNSTGLATAQTGGGLSAALRTGIAAVGGVAAGMMHKYRGSNLRANLKNANPGGDTLRAYGNALKDSVKNGAGRYLGLDDTKAEVRTSGSNAMAMAGTNLRQNGQRDLASDIGAGRTLYGNDAKTAISTLGKDNSSLQESLEGGKGYSIGRNKDGSFQASWTDKNGTKNTLSYGNKDGAYIGKQGGIPVYASGSSKSIDKLMSGGGQADTKKAAIDFAKDNGLQAGLDNKGNVTLSDNGKALHFAPEGATNLSNAQSLGNGFMVGEIGGATPEKVDPLSGNISQTIAGGLNAQSIGFETFAHSDAISSNISKLQNHAVNNGYGAPSWLSSEGSVQTGQLADLSHMTGMPISVSHMLETAQRATCDGNGNITATMNDGSSFTVSMFDGDAAGSKIANSAGIPIKILGINEGFEGGLSNILYATTPGVENKAKSIQTFFKNAVGDIYDGIELEKIPNNGVLSITADGGAIAEVTAASVANMSDSDWIVQGDYAVRLTDFGRAFWRDYTGTIIYDEEWIKEMFENEAME